MSDILTPCKNVCVLDQISGLCRGCGRSGAEIAGWLGMSNADRARIMALLPGRLAALAPVPSAKLDAK